jgi:hypothetical protein
MVIDYGLALSTFKYLHTLFFLIIYFQGFFFRLKPFCLVQTFFIFTRKDILIILVFRLLLFEGTIGNKVWKRFFEIPFRHGIPDEKNVTRMDKFCLVVPVPSSFISYFLLGTYVTK